MAYRSAYAIEAAKARKLWRDIASLGARARAAGDAKIVHLTERAAKGDPDALVQLRPYLR